MFLIWPGLKHAWPNSAACWSPAMPDMGTPFQVPTVPELSTILGRMACGMSNNSSSSLSHCPVWMLYISVLLALDASVTCVFPSVRFHMSHESMVPMQSSPACAFNLAPLTLSSIQDIFVAEK